jgi:hypothetical protein
MRHRNMEQERARQAIYRQAHREERRRYAKQYRSEHPDKVRAGQRAYDEAHRVEKRAYDKTYSRDHSRSFINYKRIHAYGLTQAEFDFLLAMQGGACAICHEALDNRGLRAHVDHDHAYPVGDVRGVRGILCHRCNTGIGLLGNEPAAYENASLYLFHKELSCQKSL